MAKNILIKSKYQYKSFTTKHCIFILSKKMLHNRTLQIKMDKKYIGCLIVMLGHRRGQTDPNEKLFDKTRNQTRVNNTETQSRS